MFINVFTNVNATSFDSSNGDLFEEDERRHVGRKHYGSITFVNSINISRSAEGVWNLATKLIDAEHPNIGLPKPLSTDLPIIYWKNSNSNFSKLMNFCLNAFKHENYCIFSINYHFAGLDYGKDLSSYIGHRLTIAIELPTNFNDYQRIKINNAFHQFCWSFSRNCFNNILEDGVVCKYILNNDEPQCLTLCEILNKFQRCIENSAKVPSIRIRCKYSFLQDSTLHSKIFYLLVKTNFKQQNFITSTTGIIPSPSTRIRELHKKVLEIFESLHSTNEKANLIKQMALLEQQIEEIKIPNKSLILKMIRVSSQKILSLSDR